MEKGMLLEAYLKQLRLPAIGRHYQELARQAAPGNLPHEAFLRAPGGYREKRENLILMGNSGTGKTHLATALGLIACQQGRKVRFFTAAGLINLLTEDQGGLRLSHLERSLAQMDLLIIDEIGYVPFSEKGAQLFFQVAAQSYERQSLIMTTNLDFSQWPQVFGSEQLTGALLDRLTHHAHILSMNGESFRFRESMSKKEG